MFSGMASSSSSSIKSSFNHQNQNRNQDGLSNQSQLDPAHQQQEPLPVSSPSPSTPSSTSSNSQSSTFFSPLTDNPLFSAGFGLMIFGTSLALARKGLTVSASTLQRRLLITLEIPSKDQSHPWFLNWMASQAKAQNMRDQGLLGPVKKESLFQFLGFGLNDHLTTTDSDQGKGKGKGKARQMDGQDGNLIGEKQYLNPLTSKTGLNVSPVRIRSHDLSVETSNLKLKHQDEEEDLFGAHIGTSDGKEINDDVRFTLVPGPGTHWFRYRGVWMRLQREKNARMVDIRSGAPLETITLTTLYRYSHLFPQLLSEARQLALNATEGKTVIYTAWGIEWRPFGKPRKSRELNSVILGRGKKERIREDLIAFMKREKWYSERGIPYRRGYLLHGSPGSGKSSFITALAGSFSLNICILNLSERGLTDDKLNHLMTNLPERSILLLEDIDSAFNMRKQTSENEGFSSNVTFSGLLNALDGVASGEKRIVFMTTNYVERLDSALIRPGRVDLIEELGDAESDQVRELLLKFYGNDGKRRRIESIDQGSEKLESEDRELRELAEDLVGIVGKVCINRRSNLGLDESGRYVLASTSTDSNLTQDPSSETLSNSPTWSQNMAFASSPKPSVPQTSPNGKSKISSKQMAAARGGVSMAELQGLFIRFPDNPRDALEAFKEENGL